MITVSHNISLAPHTTFKLGGIAEHFCIVHSEDELREAHTYARSNNLPIWIIGGGSNLLVPDEGVRGLVVCMAIEGVAYEENQDTCIVHAGAGVWFDDLVRDTVARGLWGLENLSSIPGTVGASVVQNIGAYGVEVGEVVQEVRACDTEASAPTVRMLSPEACAFGYRDSCFKHGAGKSLVVTGVSYILSKTPRPRLAYKDLARTFHDVVPTQVEIRDAVVAIRAQKFPDIRSIGTAGSFFKNPIISQSQYDTLRARYPELPGFPFGEGMVKVPIAWILDHVLMVKGLRARAVGAWNAQPLVLVNYGGASCADVDAFARMLEVRVREETGIILEREVCALGA